MRPPVANQASFKAEARYQRACACCGEAGGFHAHHAVDKATLRDKYGLRGQGLYDTRNALRLCEGLDGNRCHLNFENRGVVVKTIMLRDSNVEYAWEIMGPAAIDYLRREYDDVEDPDPRIAELESRCQPMA